MNRVIQFRSQGARLVCSSAATAMCVFMTARARDAAGVTAQTMNAIMTYASALHDKVQGRVAPDGRERMVTVPEVIEASALHERLGAGKFPLQTREIGGCVANTPRDMISESCMDLAALACLLGESHCCTLTCSNHTVSFGCDDGGRFWLCDSLMGVLVHSLDLDGLRATLDRLYEHHRTSTLEYSAVLFSSQKKGKAIAPDGAVSV